MGSEAGCDHHPSTGCYKCCTYCNHVAHRCGGCGASLEHIDCGYGPVGCCDDCQPLMQARP